MQPHSPQAGSRRRAGFTLVELLAVIAIIAILTALVLGTYKFIQEKGARSRAEAEIKAMEAALESYKADNGDYPRNGTTDGLNSKTSVDPSTGAYATCSLILYRALSGDTNLDRSVNTTDGGTDIYGSPVTPASGVAPKIYFEFKANNLHPSGGTGNVTWIADPWGYSYGYSTAAQANVNNGNNPTFDLWSTGGTSSGTTKWLKNW